MKHITLTLAAGCLLACLSANAQETTSKSAVSKQQIVDPLAETVESVQKDDKAAESKPSVRPAEVSDDPLAADDADSSISQGNTVKQDQGMGMDAFDGGGMAGFGGGGFAAGGSPTGRGLGGVPSESMRRIVSADNIIITWSKGNDQLRGFSLANGTWTKLTVPRQKEISPVVTTNVAAVKLQNGMAAYSADKQRWSILALPKDSKAQPSVSNNLVTVYDADHIYTFAASSGRWTSPTDPKLQEVKETIRPSGSPASKEAIDTAASGLNISVMSSRGIMSVQGAASDIKKFKERLAKNKTSTTSRRAEAEYGTAYNPGGSPDRQLIQRPGFAAAPNLFRNEPANKDRSLAPPSPQRNSFAPRNNSFAQPSLPELPPVAKDPRSSVPALSTQSAPAQFSIPSVVPSGQTLNPPPAFSPFAATPQPASSLRFNPSTRTTNGQPSAFIAPPIRFPGVIQSRPNTSKSETSSLALAKKLRSKQDEQRLTPSDKASLQKLVKAALDERLQIQKKSVDELRKKLKAVEDKLKAKSDNKQKMIDRRVDELLNPELDWDSVSNKSNSSIVGKGFFTQARVQASANRSLPPTTSSFGRSSSQSTDAFAPSKKLEFAPVTGNFFGAANAASTGVRLSTSQLAIQVPAAEAGRAKKLTEAVSAARSRTGEAVYLVKQRRLSVLNRVKEIESVQLALTDSESKNTDRRVLQTKLEKMEQYQKDTTGSINAYQSEAKAQHKSWESAWKQFYSAMDLQKSRVKVATEILKHHASSLERKESQFKNGFVSGGEISKAKIQLQLADLQVKAQQDVLSEFQTILEADPKLDPASFELEEEEEATPDEK